MSTCISTKVLSLASRQSKNCFEAVKEVIWMEVELEYVST